MPDDESVEVLASDLDTAPTGRELTAADYAMLAALGVVLPVILLIWGWM